VKRLSKHSDERVSNLAKEIFNKWKTHFETKLCLPVVDVQCDRKTESLRQTARRHLTAALKNDTSSDKSTSEQVDALTSLLLSNVFVINSVAHDRRSCSW